MRKKIRLFDVTIRDGYGERHEIVPGVSKAYLQPKFMTEHEKVTNIKFIGWATVVIYSDTSFQLTAGDTTQSFEPQDRGFGFLKDQFQAEIEATPNDLD